MNFSASRLPPEIPVRSNTGQALLEVAMVLPLLFLGIYTFAHIYALCKNTVELQYAAYVAGRQLSIQYSGDALVRAKVAATPVRRATPPLPNVDTELFPHWHRLTFVDPYRQVGVLKRITVRTFMKPVWGWHFFLGPQSVLSTAEFLQEPRMPEER
jgi:hypothetical protein